MAKEKVYVFYSWQSDRPGACNQSLIESALIKVLDAIRGDPTNAWDPVLEQDARGATGSPDIHNKIFEKIDRAHAVVADVTIIGRTRTRSCINPNVGIELGYTLGKHGEERLVMLQNTHFGPQDKLPFDIKVKAVKGYRSHPDDSDRAPIRKYLESVLDRELRACFAVPKQGPSPVDVTLSWEKDPRSSTDHQLYTAVAQMKNVSNRILTNWQIDLRMPRYLGSDGVGHGSEMPTRGDEPRLFVFSSQKCADQWKPFVPDEVRAIRVGYVINKHVREYPGIESMPFTVRAFVDNEMCGTATKTVAQMTNDLRVPSVGDAA